MITLLLPEPVAFDAAGVERRAKFLCERMERGIMAHDEAAYGDNYVEEIESKSRDGFWAWTSGGYQAVIPASLAYHAFSGVAPAALQPLIDTGNAIIADEWARQYPDRPPLDQALRGEHTGWKADAEQWEEEAWNTDTDAYFWKARVMFLDPEDRSFRAEEGGDEPYVYVDAYLNTDLNYGRDHIRWLSAYGSDPNQTVGSFKRAIPLREFATMTDTQLQALADEAVASLP